MNLSIKGGSISINGRLYSGNSVVIDGGGHVVVDGVQQDGAPLVGPISVSVAGDVDQLELTSGDVTVHGSAQSIKTTSGDVAVSGGVSGSVSTISGDVRAASIGGPVSTISGDVSRA